MIHTLVGIRCGGRCAVFVVDGDMDGCEPLCHWEDGGEGHERGFEWGYGGAGPRRLAEAMLHLVCGDRETAVELAQRFKWQHVARLPRPMFALRVDVVESWLIEQVASLTWPLSDDLNYWPKDGEDGQ